MQRRYAFGVVFLTALLMMVGCGDDGPSDPEAGLPTDNGLFEYVPGDNGTAAGYYVVAETSAGELTSNTAEVQLFDRATARDLEQELADGQAQRAEQALTVAPADAADEDAGAGAPFIAFDTPVATPQSSFADDFEATQRALASLGRRSIPTLASTIGGQSLGPDVDDDGIPTNEDLPTCSGGVTTSCSDNCPFVANPNQEDTDLNGVGDACEGDSDGDGVLDDGDESGSTTDNPCVGPQRTGCDDNCPNVYNYRQFDTDEDGLGDACDDDIAGSGTPDINEPAVDHDGDGIPTGEEGDGDTDGDGIPDYRDPDDDGDGIPTREEGEGDADGDGTPDYKDEDSDGDGIPDRNEAGRDTDGDGTPDFQDDDDDGDGVPTSQEISGEDQDSDGDGIPNHLDDEDNTCEGVRRVGTAYRDIPTFNGVTFWVGWTGSVYNIFDAECDPGTPTTLPNCAQKDYSWVFHLAPDGLYFSLQYAQGIVVPTFDIAGLSAVDSFGMMYSPNPNPDIITAAEMSDGRGLGYTIAEVGLAQFGFSVVLMPNAGAGEPRMRRSIQFDTGIGFSVSLLDLFVPLLGALPGLPSVALTDGGITINGPGGNDPRFVLVAAWDGECPQPPLNLKQEGSDPFAGVGSVLETASNTQESFNGPGLNQLGGGAAPFFDALATTQGFGTATNVPAPTPGDWVQEFASREGDEVCERCVNMSIDGIIQRSGDSYYAADGSGGALAAGAPPQMGNYNVAFPQREQMRQLLNVASGAIVNSGRQIFTDMLNRLNAVPYNYTETTPVRLDVPIGGSGSFTVTAQELADLIDHPDFTAADMEGVTICVENNPRIDRVCGTIEGGELTGNITVDSAEPLVLQVTADLTTSESRFGDFPVEDFTVRPAPRVFEPQAGPPASIALIAPANVRSGGPATFNAILADDNGFRVEEALTWRLFDPYGVEVASVQSDDGAASFQLIPQNYTPEVTSIEAISVTVGGEDQPGYRLQGRAISRDATIRVNGQILEDRGYLYTVVSADDVAIAVSNGTPLNSGELTVEVVNPDGSSSGRVSLTLQ